MRSKYSGDLNISTVCLTFWDLSQLKFVRNRNTAGPKSSIIADQFILNNVNHKFNLCVAPGSPIPVWLILVRACLRAPLVLADEAKLAIVFTYFFVFSLFFIFRFLRLLLFTHFGESPVRENLFPPIFWHN